MARGKKKMTVEDWLGRDNEIGIDIWKRKYQRNNESFEDFVKRNAGGDPELEKLIKERKFLFGGRTLANRGTGIKGSFSNCYSLGYIEDDLNDILKANSDMAITFKAQGGQGISLSKLRPKGCQIGADIDELVSDGIVPFMEMYNVTTAAISQGGARKGALIISLDIWHKQAEDFIRIKSENDKITKANLSLEIDDEFMNCVQNYYEHGKTDVIKCVRQYQGHRIEYEVTPIKLYKLMMEKAWDWGEPGCLFVDQMRNYNMMEFCDDYQIETCNPCGEQPLPKHGACNLGSINLSEFVEYPFTEDAEFDTIGFEEAVCVAVRSLDKVLDENLENHPLKEQREMAENYRNIGLGVMGLYDALVKLGMTYGSKESIGFVDAIMRVMFRAAFKESAKLAKELGCFPKYTNKLLESKIVKEHFGNEELKQMGVYETGLRNCSLLSIAPTGTIGTMLDISTGCEPAFAIKYSRKTESLHNNEEKTYDVYMGVAQEYRRLTKDGELPGYFVTASDIKWQDRIEMQAIMQKHVDTGISSTINLPKETTQKEIELLYLTAWKKGLKGVTIFRDGCKRVGILSTGGENVHEWKRGEIIPIQDDAVGRRRKLTTGCGSLHTVGMFDENTGELREVYLNKGSTGGCNNFMTALSRMISLCVRGGISIYEIIDQLMSTGSCPSYASRHATKGDTSRGACCPMAIGYALKDMYEKYQKDFQKGEISETTSQTENAQEEQNDNPAVCPDCGNPLVYEGGCNICKNCGWSKCF